MLQMRIPEYNHHGGVRKLHTVAPIHVSSRCTAVVNSPAWNQTTSELHDYGVKREKTVWKGWPLVSSRWSPTPEQLQALEELYRCGIRTPAAEQIQQIVARLRRFGRIEGKNVFYWFQNHKAREKQRKRRHMELLDGNNMRDFDTTERSQSGSRKCLGVYHPRRLFAPSNFSTSCKLKQMELQQHIVTAKSTEACWPWELPSCMAPNNSTAQKFTTGQENGNFIKIGFNKLSEPENECLVDILCGFKETQTLDLFPIKTKELSPVGGVEEETDELSRTQKKLAPNQFIEFLPTKKLDVFTGTM